MRLRRYDASAAAAAFMENAGVNIPADDFTQLGPAAAAGVAGQNFFDAGDRLLIDKNAGGSLTRLHWHAVFALA